MADEETRQPKGKGDEKRGDSITLTEEEEDGYFAAWARLAKERGIERPPGVDDKPVKKQHSQRYLWGQFVGRGGVWCCPGFSFICRQEVFEG